MRTACSLSASAVEEFDWYWAALIATFARRKSLLPQTVADVVALTPLFAADAQKQQAWRAFLRKHPSIEVELSLMEVVEIIQDFLLPVSALAREGKVLSGRWVEGQREWQIAPTSEQLIEN